jgi:NADPH:quinone reductase-like Zn-dependent oxidoreductase
MVAAVVLTDWGPPEVLVPSEVAVGAPGAGQILIDVRLAGVGPTDLAIRAGHLKGAFGSAPGSVLGFEAAGVVAATGEGVSEVRPGDAVVAFLPELGGYSEQVLARYWVPRPDEVDEQVAAGLPASGEAAVRVIEETEVAEGDTVLIVGAAGSVGLIATQLAVSRGARVLAAARESEFDTLASLGAIPISLGDDLAAQVRSHAAQVDVVIDVAGFGVLATAVDLAGGAGRVITLSDPHAADFGVRLSSPDGPRVADRLATVMALLAAGHLRLRPQAVYPLAEAAAVHRALEAGQLHTKVLLATAQQS